MWFITVMEHLVEDEQFIAFLGDKRTWGYFKNKKTAVRALHENWSDMWEHSYNFAILEHLGSGIVPRCYERQWFKYDKERDGYFEVEEPEFIKCIVNFALG